MKKGEDDKANVTRGGVGGVTEDKPVKAVFLSTENMRKHVYLTLYTFVSLK